MDEFKLKLIKNTIGYKLIELRIATLKLLNEMFAWNITLNQMFLEKKQSEEKSLKEYVDIFNEH